jgi:hypothetical protein
MSINNLPAAVQQIVQDEWLLRFFDDALYPELLFRNMYIAQPVPQHLGETYTFTKKGLLPTVTTALAPVTNTDLTSGLSPVSVSYEQYTGVLSQYAQSSMINLLSSGIALADLYKSDVESLGLSAGQSLDELARRFANYAYHGGRTYLTAVATATTTVTVRSIAGFQYVWVNGTRTAVSGANVLAVTITQSGTGASRNVSAATVGTITSADNAGDLIPGTLTLSANVTCVVGDSVIAATAPFSVRPNGKTTGYNIVATDVLTLKDINAAVGRLRSMAVPTHEDGFYHAYLSPDQAQQLLNDNAVQRIWDTHPDGLEYQRGVIGIAGGCKIFQSAAAAKYTNEAGITVYRGLICGKELGYEVRSSLIAQWLDASNLSATGYVMFSPRYYVAMIMRTPLDTLQQVVTNSWSFIGDFILATDVLSTIGGTTGVPYRRAVGLESA